MFSKAVIFNFSIDGLSEARIVERAFGIGPRAPAEAVTKLENHLRDVKVQAGIPVRAGICPNSKLQQSRRLHIENARQKTSKCQHFVQDGANAK